MYLNQFESTDAMRLQQVISTLKVVHGIHVNIDLDNPTAESTIKECLTVWSDKRDRVISESNFNSYQQNPEYIKSMLILEAMKLMLIEIAPKRRRARKMHESTTIDENSMTQDQLAKIVKFGRAMMDYSSSRPTSDNKEVAILNAISRVGDKLVNMGTSFGPSGLTDQEKKIVKLAQLRMKSAGKLETGIDEDLAIMTAKPSKISTPGMDNVHETTLVTESDSLTSILPDTPSSDDLTSNISPVIEPDLPGKATFSQAHHYEYQASMARSELYRNAKYAMSMLKQIDPEEEIQPWIAASLTKSANILDKIFHYLDYYKTFEPNQLPEDIDGDMELGETSGSASRENLMLIMEYSTKLFNLIKPGDKLEGWVAMKLTTASECISSSKHYMDYEQFEKHALDDHFDDARKASKKAIAENRLYEDNDPNSEELAKAQVILNAKTLSGKVQDMAETAAKLTVNDLMPLVDSIRTQFGPDAATGFNNTVKTALEQILDVTTDAKNTVDTATTSLQSGGVPSAPSDIEQAGNPDMNDTAPPDNTDISADISALGSDEASDEPEEPLGRAKKPVSEGKMTCKECGTGTYVEGRNGKMRCDECGATMVMEKWGTEMHTAEKDKGKWDGYTIEELKAKKAKLMKKETRTEAEQKTVKQIDFAIRAKQKNQWGKVKEGTVDENWPGYKKNMANQKTKPSDTDKKWEKTTKIKSEPPVVEGIFSSKPKVSVTQLSPETPSQKKAREELSLKKGQVQVTKINPKDLENPLDIPTALRRPTKNESDVDESAPSGKKAEEFITSNKKDFKKRYGKKWEQVLYATAWKKFGKKNESYTQSIKSLAEANTQFASLMDEMAKHKASFKQMVAEGKSTDPLNVGYGLEGENIRLRLINVQKKIAEQKSVIRQIMQEGVIGMLKSIEMLNKSATLEEIKIKTPYGVIYDTKSGRKSKKMFENADMRKYWLELNESKISNVRMVNPETFDAIINKNTKA